jgi:predicted Rossmann fold nucleotide-binding protein DprA/Smf involved in DNA uptake
LLNGAFILSPFDLEQNKNNNSFLERKRIEIN